MVLSTYSRRSKSVDSLAASASVRGVPVQGLVELQLAILAFRADTGAVEFSGGGPGDAMSEVRRFQTLIAADGRL